MKRARECEALVVLRDIVRAIAVLCEIMADLDPSRVDRWLQLAGEARETADEIDEMLRVRGT